MWQGSETHLNTFEHIQIHLAYLVFYLKKRCLLSRWVNVSAGQCAPVALVALQRVSEALCKQGFQCVQMCSNVCKCAERAFRHKQHIYLHFVMKDIVRIRQIAQCVEMCGECVPVVFSAKPRFNVFQANVNT